MFKHYVDSLEIELVKKKKKLLKNIINSYSSINL